MTVLSTEKNDNIDSFLVYNTDDYELSDFCVNVKITGIKSKETLLERIITPSKIMIWKIDNVYGLVDMYSKDPTLSNDIKQINNKIIEIAKEKKEPIDINILFYPDKQQKDIYMELFPTALNSFSEIDRSIPSSHMFTAQINVETKMNIHYQENVFENITKNFEDTTMVEAKLTEDELSFITQIIRNQTSPDWFVLGKKKIKKKNIADTLKLFGNKNDKKQKKETAVAVQPNGNEIFDKNTLKIHTGSEDPMYDLETIIGLENVRHEIEKLKYTLEYKKERQSRGITDNSANSLHMCFYGSPGTGKTTIARIMTGLLYEMGYIKENKCVEINGLEFKGGYVGQTEIITKGILDASIGGVLFVDEAYALCNGDNDSYGKEAVNTFIKEMEDNRDKLIVIFAGYENDMEKFLDMNSGFRSRINRYFKFENYSVIELSQILINLLRKKHLKITEDALTKCMIIFKKGKQYHEFGNGRFVNNLLEKIEEQHMLNVMDNEDIEAQDTLSAEDITDKLIKDLFDTLKY